MASSLETGNLTLEAAGHEPGIKRYVRRAGPIEEHTVVIETEALLAWAGEDGESDDIMRVDGPLELGDIVLGGFGKVLNAGGEACALWDAGIEGAPTLFVNEGDADSAAGTFEGGVTYADEGVETPFQVTTAETFVDVTASGAALITEAEPGVWQFTYYVLKGSTAANMIQAKDYLGHYSGDPNVGPQVPATAEA